MRLLLALAAMGLVVNVWSLCSPELGFTRSPPPHRAEARARRCTLRAVPGRPRVPVPRRGEP